MNIRDLSTKTNWKYIAIVVVLGLVVIGGIVWYANFSTPVPEPIEISNIKKPTPQQTVDASNWQTYPSELGNREAWLSYRNSEFGFEFQYPSFYEVLFEYKEPSTGPDIAFIIGFEAKGEYLDKFQTWGIGIYKGEVKQGIKIDDLAADVTSEDSCEQVFSLVSNSIPALRCMDEGDTGEGDFAFYPRQFYFISPSSRLFEVDYLHLDMYGNEKLIKQILSTFRFVPTP